MSWSFPVGHLFGSELRVHATFFLLLAWIGIAGWAEGGAAGAAVSLLYILILFACVVAHEFGHALTARRFGIRTPDVTLLPIGGLARLERMPEKPRFGINTLLNRMAGHAEGGAAPAPRQQPAVRPQPKVSSSFDEDQEADPDQERIEIPAFLRRQAN